MLLESAKITFEGVVPSFCLGLIGFFLLKWKLIGEEGLGALSVLAIDVTLPLLMFHRLTAGFDFLKYPEWWKLPFLGVLITCAGLLVGMLFVRFLQEEQRPQFLSLVSLQNSGYLPLALASSVFSGERLDTVLIYLFLFLLGFNLLLFSLGIYLLTYKAGGKFELKRFFNPPVIATLLSLLFVLSGLNRLIPAAVDKAIALAGECTMPLAMFVVGGNIAAIKLFKIDTKAISLLVLVKLILLPAAGLALVYFFKLPAVIGLLLVLQLSMPPATNLSVLVRQYRQRDVLISQGVFFGHVAALITIPLFLSLYFMITMLK